MTNKELMESQGNSPAMIISEAIAKGADLEKLKGLMELQERWEANESKKQYNAEMVLVHGEMPAVGKSLTNQQTHSNYAALDEIICKAKGIYTSHGFSISFYEGETPKPEHVRICADVVHRSGHKETYYYDVPMDGMGIKGNANMTKIHAKASSTSYARRYLMCMIWNIPTGDDNDGNNQEVEYITDEQKGHILDLIAEIDEQNVLDKFLAFLKLDSIDNLLRSDYKKAVSAIEAKKKAVTK